jgi:hypothetical protein
MSGNEVEQVCSAASNAEEEEEVEVEEKLEEKEKVEESEDWLRFLVEASAWEREAEPEESRSCYRPIRLHTLPPEILEIIFSFLGDADLDHMHFFGGHVKLEADRCLGKLIT